MRLDWPLIILYLLMVAGGWLAICGATYDFTPGHLLEMGGRPMQQLIWISLALVLGGVVLLIDEDLFESGAPYLYIAFILLLIVTAIVAPDIKGSRSWLVIGPVRVQPAEFAKLGTALMLAYWLNRPEFKLTTLRGYLEVFAIILLPMAIIILQSETGSALVFCAFFLALYREGLSGAFLLLASLAVMLFVVALMLADVSWGATDASRLLICSIISVATTLYLINSDGTGRTELTAPSAGSEYTPHWSRDGKQIYFMRGTDQGMQLFARTLSDGVERQLTAIDGGIVDYLFSPDETTLLYVQDIKARPVVTDVYPDLDKADARIIEDLMYKHWDEWVSTMPHPFIAKVTAQPITKGLDLLEGEPYEAPMRPFNGIEDIAFSPDGNLIAYACRKKTGLEYSLSTNSDIYLYNVSTGETTNVSEGIMGYDTNPVFSPDGRSLIWVGMERDGYESDLQVLYLYDLAKKQYRPLTADFEYNIANPTWSADSKTIYFITCREALTHIYSYQLANGKIKQISRQKILYTHDT